MTTKPRSTSKDNSDLTFGLTMTAGVAEAAEKFMRDHKMRFDCVATGLGSAEYLMHSAKERDRVIAFCCSQPNGVADALGEEELHDLGFLPTP